MNRKINITTKSLFLILGIVSLSVFTLTIAYAALNVVLTIQGSAQITASEWDIHLANPIVKSGSATINVPTIASGKSLTFSTILNMPGDYYEFTVDVVNSGSIDAMIDKVTKTPELTPEQAKYLKYEVSYQNGESISTKQNIASGVTMPIKVRIEYRSDLNNSDLPSGQVSLNLSLVLDYVQSDGTGNTVVDNGVSYDIGTEKCFNSECFYIISSTNNTVTMLAKYNLYVGGDFNYNTGTYTAYGDEATGIQDPNMLGLTDSQILRKGTIAFFSTIGSMTTNTYVYNSSSLIYPYLEKYKIFLENQNIIIEEIRLIKFAEIKTLGCSSWSCKNAPNWVTTSAYWTGTAYNSEKIYSVNGSGYRDTNATLNTAYGIRPVIVINKNQIH